MNGELPLIAGLPEPSLAPDRALRRCESVGDAMRVAIITNPRHWSQAKVARAVGCSSSYLSEIIAGTKPLPTKYVERFCCATGSLIVRQYLDLQEALRAIALRDTRADRINQICKEMAA